MPAVAKVSPLKADPSRTFSLRRMFMAEFRRRFARLQREITRLVVTEDAFGIDPRRDPLTNESSIVTNDQRWKFRTNAEQLRLFEEWLKTEIQGEILQSQVDAYWEKYIEESYKKGLGRSFEEVNKGKKVGREKNLDFYKGSKSQFIQDSFHQPASIEKVKLLAGRVYTDLQGVTETMAAEIKRTLVDGMIQGKHPRVIAKQMNERVDKIGITRANTIARTEVMRAHAEGQLDAFDKMGVTELGVSVEWSTAIANVCPLCAPLEGIVVSIKESRGMLPRHPNCRCVWLPAGVGETSKKQIKSKPEIDKAIDTSLRQEIPKKEKGKTSLREQSAKSKWGGARKKIAEDRPKSLLETIREGKAKPKPSKPTPKPPTKAAKTPPKGKATPKPTPAPKAPRVPPKPVEKPPVSLPRTPKIPDKPANLPVTAERIEQLKQPVLSAIRNHPDSQGLISIRELRAQLNLSKEEFDKVMLQLRREFVVGLSEHPHVASLTQEEIVQLVHDGKGRYFNGVALRRDTVEIVAPEITATHRGTITQFREIAKTKDIEYGVAVTKEGKKLDLIVGKSASIPVPDEYASQMKGGTFYHNHPDPANLSPPDVAFAEKWGCKIVAITEDGGQYEMTVIQAKGEWSTAHAVSEVGNAARLDSTGIPFSRRRDMEFAKTHYIYEEMTKRGIIDYKMVEAGERLKLELSLITPEEERVIRQLVEKAVRQEFP